MVNLTGVSLLLGEILILFHVTSFIKEEMQQIRCMKH